MASTVKKIQCLEVNLDAKPGSLAKVFSAFSEAKVNVLAHWAFEMGPGEAKAIFYATDFNKSKEVLTQLSLKPEACDACWIEGDDKLGSYAEWLQKVAKAGVNINATDAYSFNGRYASIFFSEEKDFSALCKALGC